MVILYFLAIRFKWCAISEDIIILNIIKMHFFGITGQNLDDYDSQALELDREGRVLKLNHYIWLYTYRAFNDIQIILSVNSCGHAVSLGEFMVYLTVLSTVQNVVSTY